MNIWKTKRSPTPNLKILMKDINIAIDTFENQRILETEEGTYEIIDLRLYIEERIKKELKKVCVFNNKCYYRNVYNKLKI